MLVLADANLRRAIAGALWAGFAAAGQARGSIERVYVAREVHERFLAGLVAGARVVAGLQPHALSDGPARTCIADEPASS